LQPLMAPELAESGTRALTGARSVSAVASEVVLPVVENHHRGCLMKIDWPSAGYSREDHLYSDQWILPAERKTAMTSEAVMLLAVLLLAVLASEVMTKAVMTKAVIRLASWPLVALEAGQVSRKANRVLKDQKVLEDQKASE
jgi:hypothetical protein